MVRYVRKRYRISERHGCRLFRLSRSTSRYVSRRSRDLELRKQLRDLAGALPRYGYKRLHRRLRRLGVRVNHKKIYRLYCEEGLKVRKRGRKRYVVRLGKGALPSG